jgi:2-oxoisovalerate dehydrogenase E1 component
MVASASDHGTVGVLIEPIALYHTADLHEPGDGLWCEPVADISIDIGAVRHYGPTDADVTTVTWGNGLWMSLRVAAQPEPIRCAVIDLRWIVPLPIDSVLALHPDRVLVVDETRRSGGVSEGIVAGLVDHGFGGSLARVTSKDSFIPLGDAANLVLQSEAEIEEGVPSLASRGRAGVRDELS